MKKFMVLSIGFEPPTPEIMGKFQTWMETLGPHIVGGGGLMNGKEISDAGVKDLPFDLTATTGYLVIQAESQEAAMKLVEPGPYITSTQLFEIREQG